jgi:hypothetical protein
MSVNRRQRRVLMLNHHVFSPLNPNETAVPAARGNTEGNKWPVLPSSTTPTRSHDYDNPQLHDDGQVVAAWTGQGVCRNPIIRINNRPASRTVAHRFAIELFSQSASTRGPIGPKWPGRSSPAISRRMTKVSENGRPMLEIRQTVMCITR